MKRILSRYLILAGVAAGTIITLKYCSLDAKLRKHDEGVPANEMHQNILGRKEAAETPLNYKFDCYKAWKEIDITSKNECDKISGYACF